MNTNLVILAGGVSSRMRRAPTGAAAIDNETLAQVQERPKSMIGTGPGGRPLMDYLLVNARNAGLRDIVIVIGEHSSVFRSYYGVNDRDNRFHGLTISYAVQPIPPGRTKPLGTADAMEHALRVKPEWRGQHFLVCNSDNLYSPAAFRLLMESADEAALIDYDRDALQFDRSRIGQFAVIAKTPDGYVTDILEKPGEERIAALAGADGRVGVSMNIFQFSYDSIVPILGRVPLHPVRMEKEIPTAVTMLIAERPRAVRAIPLAEYVPDLTHPGDIPAVRDYLERNFPDPPWSIDE